MELRVYVRKSKTEAASRRARDESLNLGFVLYIQMHGCMCRNAEGKRGKAEMLCVQL